MSIEIEKICRTCLSLSGPFLSMYDGSSAKFSIADMLGKFARIKAQQKDNLPEKVCLSCISEINHCYSFMLKCENSNRTLRQLLPNALPEELDTQQLTIANKQIVYSKAIQTIDSPMIHSKHTQTLDIITNSKLVQTETSTNDEIILELNAPEPTQQIFLEDDENELKGKLENIEPTYYEITRDFDDSEEFVESQETKYQTSKIYLPKEQEDDENEAKFKNIQFTIYSHLEGESEILINRALNSERRKDEFQCSQCIATFVSEKNLKKHMIKRHGVNLPTDSDITENDSQNEFIDAINEENGIQHRSNKEVKKSKLSDNETVVQPIVTQTIPKKLRFFCEQCNAGFARLKTLHFHRNLNSCMKKSFQCDECQRVFLTQGHLDDHKATHVLSDICNLCNKLCESREELSQHMVEEHKRSIRNQCITCKKGIKPKLLKRKRDKNMIRDMIKKTNYCRHDEREQLFDCKNLKKCFNIYIIMSTKISWNVT